MCIRDSEDADEPTRCWIQTTDGRGIGSLTMLLETQCILSDNGWQPVPAKTVQRIAEWASKHGVNGLITGGY